MLERVITTGTTSNNDDVVLSSRREEVSHAMSQVSGREGNLEHFDLVS